MTNTLHRYSDHYAAGAVTHPRPIENDYVVFAMATRGVNDDRLLEKYRTFLRLALEHHAINIGDATKGGVVRPSPTMRPSSHWRRDQTPDPEAVIQGLEGHTTTSAVFRTYQDMAAFVADVKAADLGVSINISAPMDAARKCCQEAGIRRHSVEYSLGFQGRVDRLPDRQVLELSTMCGHGMVSFNLTRKMLDWVREGRRPPQEAARYLARFCVCGVFNPARAEEILDRARGAGP